VSVGGTSVAVGGMGVFVGGIDVAVGGMGVLVGGIGVAVGGMGVFVGGIDVAVGGMGVVAGWTGASLHPANNNMIAAKPSIRRNGCLQFIVFAPFYV
jgi:hypothetical protein